MGTHRPKDSSSKGRIVQGTNIGGHSGQDCTGGSVKRILPWAKGTSLYSKSCLHWLIMWKYFTAFSFLFSFVVHGDCLAWPGPPEKVARPVWLGTAGHCLAWQTETAQHCPAQSGRYRGFRAGPGKEQCKWIRGSSSRPSRAGLLRGNGRQCLPIG